MSGIRTQHGLFLLITYGNLVARDASKTVNAVAHCTPFHATVEAGLFEREV
jgi:hypothetical protein